jgi:hypothetical protein
MSKATAESVVALINLLEGFRGNKSAQASYLQAFIQQYGPVPEEYGDKVRKLLE